MKGGNFGDKSPGPSGESESEVALAQSSPTLCDPIDCSLSGSSVHGIFQARVLEWIAIVLRFKILPFVEVMKRLSNILNVLVFYLTPLYLRISWN